VTERVRQNVKRNRARTIVSKANVFSDVTELDIPGPYFPPPERDLRLLLIMNDRQVHHG
jgi:hypothetical protein